MSQPPVLQSERLTLGPVSMAHVEAFTAFAASERSRHLGGPSDNPRDAWDSCLIHAGQWAVRGYGTFWLTETATGRPAGRVGLWHPVTMAEPELSWVIFDGFEGRGYAEEAARTIRVWAWEEKGLGPLHSDIAPGNARSLALAERLGAVLEGTMHTDSGKEVQVWRHPAAEAAA
ncbi:GNAT family N-acetyltransferase [Pseudoroseicyclus tamaricis]|uniref:GNAT family N-acetyltransferase n=1 Tax=Pseudoroseicyclus tamaricis TaxID=2705421 RepID=A0A6B2JWB7_9RHOB|nr:GNAT family N-acetyltransferase [Pseudoroseicyclus tamaricis]NDU99661.1 GNAT family N-acetyltransferase [Pseudoroseicyclus tamaricis]